MIDEKQTVAELFADWLAQNVPFIHITELYRCFSEIEDFCLKVKVLNKPLLETTDLDTVKLVKKTVMENRLFQLSYKKIRKKSILAIRYYVQFIKALAVKTAESIPTEETRLAKKAQLASMVLNEPKNGVVVETKDDGDFDGDTTGFNQKVNLDYMEAIETRCSEGELNTGESPDTGMIQEAMQINAVKHLLEERTFCSYLHDSLGMFEAACRSCVLAIRSAEKFAVENHLASTRLFDCPATEASKTAKLLFNDINFLKYDLRHRNLFRAAIKKLLDYAEDAGADLNKARIVRVVQPSPAEPARSEYSKLFEHVLEKYFVKGFRLGSALDLRKFKRYYEEMNQEVLNADDETIEKIIRRCGIVHENKVFLPKTMLSEEVEERLYSYIDGAFASGKKSIYFEALFREFSEDFLDHYIYDEDMLRSFLAFECGDKYIIGKNELSKETGVTADPIDEVRTCLKEHGGPMETGNLCAALEHLPRNTVLAILGSNREFVRNRKGEYFHADILALSEEELENIANLIEDAIRTHKFISGIELMNAIRAKYPRTYEGYSSYSNIGWRDALKYKYGDRFSFKGNIISHSGETLSMSDAFGQLVRDADTVTIDELSAFAKEMGTAIYFDAVYENALRINEDAFVSKDRAAFKVRETDAIIDRFCTGNYVPLSSFCEFGIFPDAGFPWSVYLLESYAAFYSERYTLIHCGYNRNCAVGAIVKKNADYKNFDDLIVEVIADSGIPLKKANALDYLVKSGYMARRSYAGMEELLIRANAQRNRKGRP